MPQPKRHEPSLEEIPIYKSHLGTVKIAGSTPPGKAAGCAFHYLDEKKEVEFFCVGGNANYVATKAMGILLKKIEEDTRGEWSVAFQPRRYRTVVHDGQTDAVIDCVVWNTVLVDLRNNTNEQKAPEKEASGEGGDKQV